MPQPKKASKVVYTVVERKGSSKFWLRLGLAFVNPD